MLHYYCVGRFFLWLCFAFCVAAPAQTPEWIWHDEDPSSATNQIRYFQKVFSCDFKPEKAELVCAADDEMTVYLNGREVADGMHWNKPVTVDVRSQINAGQNLLAIEVKNHTDIAGLLLKLELRTPNGFGIFIVSDNTWKSSKFEEAGWKETAFAQERKPAKSFGKLGIRPWGDILDEPAATPAESLTLLPGFKAELLKSAGRDEGSWICMTIDHKGRFIISPEKTEWPLLRITVSKAGRVVKTERLAAPMRAAMGLLYAYDSLYVNGRGPKGVGLYRLIDRSKNDQFEPDEIVLLKNFDGDNEHGYHAVALGPDKKIYVMNGNHTKVPPGLSLKSPHANYAEDLLLPRMWDANGHAKGVLAPGGYVLQTDCDGKEWKLFCGGFRNTYDLDFNRDGEMFTFDSDMEWDIGAPWYRPTRINHCVSGGEYGWRSGSGKWPVYYPDSLPSNLDIGLSSPTGVKFGAKSRFPRKYQDAFFVADWAYGKIFAVHLHPEGASYGGTFETFVSGKPLNVVDLEFGKDGAMYFIIGGWKTQSGLYRVSYLGGPHKSTSLASDDRAALRFAKRQRDIRHLLESFHGKESSDALDLAWPYLGHPDRWLRFAARIAVESQSVSRWADKALAEASTESVINALLALTRQADKSRQEDILLRLLQLLQRQLTEEQEQELLRVMQLCFIRLGQPAAPAATKAVALLAPRFPAKTENVNRELCQLLVYLEAPDVLSKTLALMEKVPTQQEQMHYAFVLRNVTNGWTMSQRKTYFQWFNRALDEYKGGASFHKFLINIRAEAATHLNTVERNQLAVILEGPAATKAQKTPARSFVKEWSLEELLPHLKKVAHGRSYVRGKEAFAAAQCIACHRVGNEGGAAGPDLNGVAGRFGRRDLLENILLPSKVISDRYQNLTVIKKDGDEVSGCITEETPEKLVLVTNLATNERAEVPKNEIEKRSTSTLSAMPEGLVNVLSREEILDLLAYLEADGKNDPKVFATK